MTFRWASQATGGTANSPTVNFAVTLGLNDGTITFKYGAMPTNVSGVVGISYGNGATYTLASTSGQTGAGDRVTGQRRRAARGGQRRARTLAHPDQGRSRLDRNGLVADYFAASC